MKRALVVMLGNADIGNAIVSGIQANQLIVPQYKEDAKKSVHYANGCKDWKGLYYDMIENYGFPEDWKPEGFISRKMSAAWAFIYMSLFDFAMKMAEKNKN